ncbi:bifunctional UDP-N-acetylglucosamine diphosphorylase/glucosamine-1-phosphate N-acetyltransferase GlmU [Formicincola oecophyllae]|uniref:Bifunctional protein GlmU n=1 Tax=Formicincola oecophyllae TaxID=2558361 RepID=A0A4Y6UCU3_9PROT|nr:bifunctional UDP-N-acetylglucosamine diphosphorylase/glucosamine-1-phosphate N-acetyltransferase GlmU [Formicincola oecophyllae]QDH14211.1 bifunctional UDP-N-acetylglucosamine diphosphorylase/glucosamine-1-phosphate N-acetyltransferase GlmU [Formicincola oecophyllae]
MTASSTTTPARAVILAAGRGTRMKSAHPKAMQRLGNQPLVAHLLAAAQQVFDSITVIVGPEMAALEEAVQPHATTTQHERRGTGHAAAQAAPRFGAPPGQAVGDVMVLCADNPLMTAATMERALQARRQPGVSLVLVTMRPNVPGRYGRVILNKAGLVERIVEHADATAGERALTLCNAGSVCANGDDLARWLGALTPANAQGELYLTDVVAQAAQEGHVVHLEISEDEAMGINDRAQLAMAEAALQKRLRAAAMAGGATLVAPETVFLSADTQLGPDSVVEPNVFFGPGVVVEGGATIRAFSHLEGCTVGEGSVVGPYARLRPGTKCAPQSHVGNFVELKNTHLGQGSKANHLSYLGDADIGPGTNIGAGTVTCNYDGFGKHRTVIGQGAFVGSDSILVAPVRVGDGALVGAGSVITEDVPDEALALGRARQANRPGRAPLLRRRLAARAAQGKAPKSDKGSTKD